MDRLALGIGAGTGGRNFHSALLARVRPFMFERPKLRSSHHRGVWIHADVGYELRVRNGFSMFVTVGMAYLINQSAAICYRGAGCANDRTLAPDTVLPPIFTLTVGLGVAPRL